MSQACNMIHNRYVHHWQLQLRVVSCVRLKRLNTIRILRTRMHSACAALASAHVKTATSKTPLKATA